MKKSDEKGLQSETRTRIEAELCRNCIAPSSTKVVWQAEVSESHISLSV